MHANLSNRFAGLLLISNVLLGSASAATTQASTTQASTTQASTTQASTTQVSTTQVSTTQVSTTQVSTTQATTNQAASLEVTIAIPRLDVAEYHRPYVAIWLEDANHQSTQLAVWYDVAKRENKGLEWLKDMRQWWRRGGRTLTLPSDGLSGATRGPGEHRASFAVNATPLAELAPGKYQLRVEASREVGGRELLSIPISWPLLEPLSLDVQGEEELDQITVQFNP